MFIRRTENTNDADWLALRGEFVPELTLQEQPAYLAAFARESADFCAFVAKNGAGEALGFAEVSIRRDYVNGCRHRPALYLEGIFVRPASRGQGVARAVCFAAEQWGLEKGCREFASDVYIDDNNSLAAHVGLGFVETERVVYLRKKLQVP